MALKFSTALRNALAGGVIGRHVATYSAGTIAAVDGGSSNDQLTDSANGFVTAGISVGDTILVLGFTGNAVGLVGPFEVKTVAVGTIEVPTGSLGTGDAAGETVTIVVLRGGSLKSLFKDGVLKIYSGSQPASADAAITGTLLLTITLASGAFTSGAIANGLEFGVPSAGAISKDSGVWSGVGLADGSAGYFRLYANATDSGAVDNSATYMRIDGTCGTQGQQLNMTSLTIATGATTTINTFTLTIGNA